MNNPDLYNRTVDILVQAYFNDTLEHSNCRACAVGNIVADNMGMQLKNAEKFGRIAPVDFEVQNYSKDSGLWYNAIYGGFVEEKFLTEDIKIQCNSTGYTPEELSIIEHEFESASRGNSDDEWMFNGLMAVIEVLDNIHGNEDAAISQATKNRFNKVQNPIK